LISPLISAAQENFPNKPIRLVVPFPPGATSDNVGRIVASKLQEALGQPVVVDNRPGAGGTIGTDAVAKSAADGYTLLSATNGFLAIAPHVMAVKYDPLMDFQPISLVGDFYSVVAVHPSVPATSLLELVALAKRQPGKLNFGSAGNGSVTHLLGEVFKNLTGVDMVHVPYKGSAAAITDVLAGRLQLLFDPAAMPHVQAGKLRALAVTTPTRWPELPNVPTMAEAGVDGFKARVWFGLMAPAGLPPRIVKILNERMVEILARPDAKEALARIGLKGESSTPDALTERIREDHEFYGRIVKVANVKTD
jgi:tripartite-type tricarboxylate transporter receptor subunit TctC